MVAILKCSEREFGGAARDRYAALLLRAMRDVADEPTRPDATLDRTIDPGCRFYHIRHSRTRVANPPGRVGEPCHLLGYEIAADGIADILAIVPDPVPREVAIKRIRRIGAATRLRSKRF